MVYTLEEDPTDTHEALSSLNADLWQEAIKDEMDSLESNNTQYLVDLSFGCKLELIDLSAIHNLDAHQMDVKTTF